MNKTLLQDLCETLGAQEKDFDIGNNGIALQNRNLRFYHNNLFSSRDFEMLCERHNLEGNMCFNSNSTISFMMKRKVLIS